MAGTFGNEDRRIRTINDNVPVIDGQTVWLYPADEKHGGTIVEYTISKIDNPWQVYFCTKPGERRNCHYFPHSHTRLYSTLESAKKQKAEDRAEPMWIRRGKFHVGTSVAVAAYLAHKAGLEKANVAAHKTESGTLHVTWADSKGLHKEKLRIGPFYDVAEADLAPLVEKMRV